jgi:hypothetical protein
VSVSTEDQIWADIESREVTHSLIHVLGSLYLIPQLGGKPSDFRHIFNVLRHPRRSISTVIGPSQEVGGRHRHRCVVEVRETFDEAFPSVAEKLICNQSEEKGYTPQHLRIRLISAEDEVTHLL